MFAIDDVKVCDAIFMVGTNVLVEKAAKLNSHHSSKKDDIYWTPYLVGEVLFLKNK